MEIRYFLSEHDRDQAGESPFVGVRMEHIFEEIIVKDLYALIAAADIKKFFLMPGLEAEEFFLKLWDGRNLPSNLLDGPVLWEFFSQSNPVRLLCLRILV